MPGAAGHGHDWDFGSSPTLFGGTGIPPEVGACNKNGTYYALAASPLGSAPRWADTIGAPRRARGSVHRQRGLGRPRRRAFHRRQRHHHQGHQLPRVDPPGQPGHWGVHLADRPALRRRGQPVAGQRRGPGRRHLHLRHMPHGRLPDRRRHRGNPHHACRSARPGSSPSPSSPRAPCSSPPKQTASTISPPGRDRDAHGHRPPQDSVGPPRRRWWVHARVPATSRPSRPARQQTPGRHSRRSPSTCPNAAPGNQEPGHPRRLRKPPGPSPRAVTTSHFRRYPADPPPRCPPGPALARDLLHQPPGDRADLATLCHSSNAGHATNRQRRVDPAITAGAVTIRNGTDIGRKRTPPPFWSGLGVQSDCINGAQNWWVCAAR